MNAANGNQQPKIFLNIKCAYMKKLWMLFVMTAALTGARAQLLKKLKQKAEQAVEKAADKKIEGKEETKQEPPAGDNTGSNNDAAPAVSDKKDLKVYSRFDFVPGGTIQYFDNFEKDNIGETPEGWITSSAAEVVEIEGLEGKWLKMAPVSARHIVRNKKQSWGNNFTIEFDLLIVKKGYDPRMGIALINTAGKMVTDETILLGYRPVLLFESIIVAGGKSRISLTNKDNKTISDNMNEELYYGNTTPVHISLCVQGKRFRMWWNEKKLYDMGAINEEYMPNQFGFEFGSVGGSEFYVSNIRVAKDVPDTRARFEQGKIVSNLLFYTGTDNLRSESMGSLLDVSKVLKEAAGLVKIVGHTDSDGDDASNQKLSLARAEAVKKILVQQYGIDEGLLTTEGRGEAQPIADNKIAEGKAQNRRVEFIFKAGADVYSRPAVAGTESAKSAAAGKSNTGTAVSGSSSVTAVKLQGKVLTVTLPFAHFMKTADNRYVFMASKEEGNNKENYFSIELETPDMKLKPATFNFKEANEKNPLYGTKKFAEIKNTTAVLYYGAATRPYIYKFSPIVASGHMGSYVTASLERKLPPVSPNCKLVIEKVEDGKASGYFVFGLMNKGLPPITKGDAMTETFTEGFAGEVKGTFTNVPVL